MKLSIALFAFCFPGPIKDMKPYVGKPAFTFIRQIYVIGSEAVPLTFIVLDNDRMLIELLTPVKRIIGEFGHYDVLYPEITTKKTKNGFQLSGFPKEHFPQWKDVTLTKTKKTKKGDFYENNLEIWVMSIQTNDTYDREMAKAPYKAPHVLESAPNKE